MRIFNVSLLKSLALTGYTWMIHP